MIHEKRPREEIPESLPSKKGKIDDSRGKQAMPNKGRAKIPSSQLLEKAPRPNLVVCWVGPGAFIIVNAAMVAKILVGVIFPFDREKVDKLSLD